MSMFAATYVRTRSTPGSAASDITRWRKPWLPWIWMTIASVLLGGSVLARSLQDQRFATRRTWGTTPPFRLKDLPTKLEGWKVEEKGETQLDPQIARVAGAADHVVRRYVDEQTGVALTVLILFGRGDALSVHSPEACYPLAGYAPAGEPFEFPVTIKDNDVSSTARFRSVAYYKPGGLKSDRQETVFGFRHAGEWIPEAASRWKQFRHDPVMFKIHIQRPIIETERRQVNNPALAFLGVFLPQFEKQLADSQAKGNGPPTPAPPATRALDGQAGSG
jgi:hypothetical protein